MAADSQHVTDPQVDFLHPAAPPPWITPADRQAAARDAYRASVTAGSALGGAALGRMFERSPRWGTDRITEVRTEDIAGRNPKPSGGRQTLPIGTHTNGSPRPPTGSNGRPGTADRDAAALPIGTNGNGRGPASLPIGSHGGAGASKPHGNGTSAIGRRAASRSHRNEAPRPPASEAPNAPRSLVLVTVAAVMIVAGVTLVTSYTHTHDLAVLAGWGWLAWILPAAIDGLVVAGSTSLMVDRRLQGGTYSGHPLAWAAVAIGLASSMAANIVAVDPALIDLRVVRWVMAGYAPLALAVSGHLLLRMLGERQ